MNDKDYIYGKNSCRATLEHNKSIKSCIISNNFNDKEILKLLEQRKIEIKKVGSAYMDNLFHNANHQGIALVVPPYTYYQLDDILNKLEDKKEATIVLLDSLEDPQNFGAIIRSCDAFSVDAIIITSNRSVSVTPTVSKVSTGAIEYVPIVMVANLNNAIDKLKKHGFWIVASDGKAKESYSNLKYDFKVGLVIGSEGKGISQLVLKNADFVTKIEMDGHVNSLNASVAAGIYLAMIKYKRSK